MITITYKNVLRPEKEEDDFLQWLQIWWPRLRDWGATSVKLWSNGNGDSRILYCQYTVSNLETWNRSAVSSAAQHQINELAKVVDLNRMSMKIKVTYEPV